MTIYDQTGKIVEKKFYHSEWKLTDLLKARNDGLLTDEGEAWKYRYSHMDGTGGKYQPKCNQGLLEHKSTTVLRADGSEKISEQVRITPNGLSALAKAMPQAALPLGGDK